MLQEHGWKNAKSALLDVRTYAVHIAVAESPELDFMAPMPHKANVSRIRSKNTKPEMMIRRMLHGLGYRYSLHRRDLPGVPDLVFPSRKKAILVHGCFWHQHSGCIDGRLPKSRENYWLPKLLRNTERDRLNIAKLRRGGWQVLKLWECDILKDKSLQKRLTNFLD
jgi:DNA mismatch endonuclease, patch repair protein